LIYLYILTYLNPNLRLNKRTTTLHKRERLNQQDI
jgi:hypothetical protein